MSGGSAGPPAETKPFYALGINIARQVGGELKGILSKDEVAAMLQGFSDSMTDKTVGEVELLQEFGPKLNEILQGRASMAVDKEKARGKDFATSFLLKKASRGSVEKVYWQRTNDKA